MAIITLNNNSLSSVTSLPNGVVDADALASGVGGKVLQVVTATNSTSLNINATTYTDTGLTATITPSSTSSKIFIVSSQGVYGYINANNPRKFFTQLVRGSTAIAGKLQEIEAAIGSRNIHIQGLDGGFSCLDSPSTTSAVTYKTQGKLDSNANSSVLVFHANNEIATMTLMEISG